MRKQVLCACSFCLKVSNNADKYVSISTRMRHQWQEKDFRNTSTTTLLINIQNLNIYSNNIEHCNRSEITNHSFNSLSMSINPSVIIFSLSENELGSDDIEESELGSYCFEKNELELDNSEKMGEQESSFFTAFNSLENNNLCELESN
ncbi:25188_t:CDS:2 [Racocetra persica]|uniref:25188_t:CDS:1 n=1 Tax=Racocetra persica TaxID=160502 RepID=A0ACA9KS54_9GLOM|nr:25188_t:CDS:2 [Racocetra persica]